jgi:glycosyltransferase involved in cell wall biosynthesis
MLLKRIGVIMYQTSKSKGQELVAQRMVREFIRLGHKAYLITSIYHDGMEVVSPKNLGKIGAYVYTEDKELGIPIIRVDSHIGRWPPRRIFFRDFIPTLEKIVDKFQLDVLVTHSTLWNGPEEVAKFIEWRRDMKNMGGYQDPLVFCHMSHFQEPSPKRYSLVERSFRIAWNKLTLPQIFSTANLILVVTTLEKEAKVKMGAKAEKCFLFPGGVDEEILLGYVNVDVKSFFKQLKIKETAKVVSYLGSLEERKNPLAVLKVADKLQERKDIHFVIAGRGDSPYAKKVINMANSLPNVTYLGEVSEQEKMALIKASHLNILLSQLEALGLAQIEFMYFGVPIITSAVGGQAWLVRNEVEGIHVDGPDDIEGAASAITRLVDNSTLWNRLSSNAKDRATSLTMSKLTAELDEAITEELVKERGLMKIPSEVRVTLAEPESVLKSWSSGNWGVIATGRRLFIRRGIVSRKVTEIPYANISSIEYLRRYPWKTLAIGSVVSLLLFIEPFLRPIFSRAFISRLEELVRYLLPGAFLQSPFLQTFLDILPIIPFLIAVVAFAVQARTGFALRGPGIHSLYLPRRFQEVITFIRSVQNGQLLKRTDEEDTIELFVMKQNS